MILLGMLQQCTSVDSVPLFVVNGKITLSGAQQPDTFIEAFRQAGGSDK